MTFALTAVILIAVSIVRDGVFLPTSSLIGLPLGGALVAVALAFAKRARIADFQQIIPPPTVSLLVSSIRMNEPVARLRA